MFEFKIAFKYLLFRKKRLSSSIISLLSVLIISIVVWLILVFLSVTNGIEKNWLNKLTALNAPIRISLSDEYYSSYYYLIDNLSSNSNYSPKTIKEKINTEISDPYDINMDMELPHNFPKPIYQNGIFTDPLKKLYAILEKEKKHTSNFNYQDYELSAALMRLSLNRTKKDLFTEFKEEKINFLTQMTYLISLTENNPNLKSLLVAPSAQDINHLISQMNKSYDNVQKDIPSYPKTVAPALLKTKLKNFFSNILIEEIELEKGFSLNLDLLKANKLIKAQGLINNNTLKSLILTDNKYTGHINGEIIKENEKLYFKASDNSYEILNTTSIHLGKNIICRAKLNFDSLEKASSYEDIKLSISSLTEDLKINGIISFKDVKLKKAKINNKTDLPLYCFSKDKLIIPNIDDKTGILLPKNHQSNNIFIGDTGYLSYTSMTINSNQEIRIPIFVAGFYDTGVLPIGSKCLIVPSEITKTINATNNSIAFDGTPINGIYVWIKDIKKASLVANKLKNELEKENILSFFNITTYKDFEFSKDLMQQFQSDRTLFTIIAMIILIAACSNIISMLVLLVNDKKKEIAILRSMGAKPNSIKMIFGFCGFFMGFVSSFIGILAAIFTLKYLDVIIKILSLIQGHNFFNSTFFGSKMPNELSLNALFFVLIITPILALVAGLIPAIKACRIHPSSTLRSQ